MQRTIKKVLGRGLEALIPAGKSNVHLVQDMPIDQIIPNPYQPRKYFDQDRLKELIDSIRQHGIIQPILVAKIQDGSYQIVAGERRWRAAKEAGVRNVPVIIKDLSPQNRVALALVENLQRHDLNALEEAQAFHFLVEGFGLTQEDLGKRVGRSRPYITNVLRLLNLPDPVKSLVVDGRLSSGHARALLGLNNSKEAIEMAKRIAEKRLSVRQTESLVKQKGTPIKRLARAVDPVEKKLERTLGARVRIQRGISGGKIEILFRNHRELEKFTKHLVRTSSLQVDEKNQVHLQR